MLYLCNLQGKQGPVEHIYRGVLFIYDRHHLEHAGFICAKSQACLVVGGSRGNRDKIVRIMFFMLSLKFFPMENEGGGDSV